MTDGFPIARPESLGFEPRMLSAIGSAVRNGRLRNVHGVVVLRYGVLAHEEYFPGRDEHWGSPLGEVAFGPDTLHDIRSVTKSVVGLLYGIAHAHGSVGSIDRPLLDAFPEFVDLRAEPARMKLTIRHALTMTMGTEWDETLPYSDPRNSERLMEEVPDRYRFVLDRPLVAAAGERWSYNGGATAVIAKIVSRATGRPLIEFAGERFFGPLGIKSLEWITDRNGDPIAASGLRLTPRDLAKIGQLVLNRGRWGNEQIVSEDWITESSEPHAQPDQPLRYGYQWWLGASAFGDVLTPWVAGFGNGGQRLFVLRDLDLVAVVTAGNYNQPEQWRAPMAVLNQFVLPALAAGPGE